MASHLLSLVARRLPQDWHDRYRRRPVLLETFCDATCFRGTCYRAANWIHVGHTQGRGKLDVHRWLDLPVKHILLKPILPADHRTRRPNGYDRRCERDDSVVAITWRVRLFQGARRLAPASGRFSKFPERWLDGFVMPAARPFGLTFHT